jgi:hypothetical protein
MKTHFIFNNVVLTVVAFMAQCVRKVTMHLQKLLEVMSTSVYTGLNPFNYQKPSVYVLP